MSDKRPPTPEELEMWLKAGWLGQEISHRLIAEIERLWALCGERSKGPMTLASRTNWEHRLDKAAKGEI